MARRLWARFEVLPFRHGMALLGGALALAGLLIAGVLTTGGGSHERVAASPARPSNSPAEAGAPPAPTWGAYVPPRRTTPAPVPARPLVTSAPTHARSARPSSRPTTACPSSLKKWPWVWEVCKRKQSQ